MRNILFRAKRTDNGEWVEGSLLVETHDIAGSFEKRCKISDITYGQDDEGFATYMSGVEEYVDPDTVCEWTGLYDKNGKKIFEDDIVLVNGKHVDHVIFSNGCFCMENQMLFYEFTYQYKASLEVIGNIYDNPDLLEH